jgi:hypothetical protein
MLLSQALIGQGDETLMKSQISIWAGKAERQNRAASCGRVPQGMF